MISNFILLACAFSAILRLPFINNERAQKHLTKTCNFLLIYGILLLLTGL